jgi:triphosphoribosyl-dephospho-CoA synthase
MRPERRADSVAEAHAPALAGEAARVALAASLACVLEVSAEKVGNVTPTRGFADASFRDFVAGAVVLGPAIARARPGRVGRTVWEAVEAMRRVTATNTSLGMALLFSPIAAAWSSRDGRPLRHALATALRGLDVEDAEWAYRAIRHVDPGGLGSSEAADVRETPRITLRDAMALAADRDSIAREYVEDFGLTFDVALPALEAALRAGLPALDAIVQAHLELLAACPDTLVARKAGRAASLDVTARARHVVRAGGVRTPDGRATLAEFDRHLRADGNRLNPGTSADVIAAALFVRLLTAVE